MGRSQESGCEGQEMEKAIIRFEKGRDYLAKTKDENGKLKIYRLHCTQGQGHRYEKDKPVFNNGNGTVQVLDFDLMTADNESFSVETAIVRIFRNHDWSKDLEVLAFPVDMPKFEYENNQTK